MDGGREGGGCRREVADVSLAPTWWLGVWGRLVDLGRLAV